MRFLKILLAALLAASCTPALAQVAPDYGHVTTSAPTYTTNTDRPLSLTTSGELRVSPSSPSGTQNVTGTGTAGTPATGVVTVQGITSGTPVIATGSGTAGSAAAGVVTVQGIASMTALATYNAGGSFTNITTNTDTNVKGSAGTILGFSVNTVGTTSTLKLYNDADGTCSSGLIGTFTTTAQAFVQVPAIATIGICAQTAGAGAADITVYWR